MAEQIKLIVASATQTGDIPHIAGALALCPTINALILYDDTCLVINELRDLYQRAAATATGDGKGRVDFLLMPPSQDPEQKAQKQLYLALKCCDSLPSPDPGLKKRFEAVGLGDEAYEKFKTKYSVSISNDRAKYVVRNLSQATGEIAEAYKSNRIGSYEVAAKAMILDAQLSIGDIISVNGKDVSLPPPTAEAVLLVWTRYTGTKTDTGFNPEGDSDPTGQNQLVDIATKSGFSVITVGDVPQEGFSNVDNKAACQLGEFWRQEPYESRAAQWSFLAALMQRYPGRLYQIGQKSGAMDFLALIGVPTIYIEDSHIADGTTRRMRQWTKEESDSLQLYCRLEVTDPPSLPGKALRRFPGKPKDTEATKAFGQMGTDRRRIAVLLFELQKKWTKITVRPELDRPDEIPSIVNGATPELLQTWKKNINDLSEKELKEMQYIRGYTADDLTKVEIELKVEE